MKIEDLSLAAIDGQRHLTTSDEIVRAVAYAARRGYGNVSCYRFVTAVMMLEAPIDVWPQVLKKIDDLKTEIELAALMSDRVVSGEIE